MNQIHVKVKEHKQPNRAKILTSFWLQHTDNLIKTKYNSIVEHLALSKVIFIISTLICFLNLFFMFYFPYEAVHPLCRALTYVTTFSNLFLVIIFVFISRTRTRCIQATTMSCVFITFTINQLLIKHRIEYLFPAFNAEIIFFTLEVVFKILWAVSYLNSFIHVFFSNILSFVLIVCVYFVTLDPNIHGIAFISIPCYFLLYFIVNLTSYSINRYSKTLFYLKYTSASQDETFNQIMNVISTGYVKISSNKEDPRVECINNFFLKEDEYFQSLMPSEWGEIANSINNSNILDKNKSCSFIHHILSEDVSDLNKKLVITSDSYDVITVPRVESQINETKEILLNRQTNLLSLHKCMMLPVKDKTSLLQRIINKKEYFTLFTYVGKKVIRNDKKTLSLKIYSRVREDESINLLLVDVSKEDLLNGIHNYIIQSGQFLHDFKNPLLSITEELAELKTINDSTFEFIYQNCQGNNQEQADNYFMVTEKFEFLLKMADYCKCMIASYEDFSKGIFNKEIKLSVSKFNLVEMLDFIENMMVFRITKANKNVNFILNYDTELMPTMMTDENKLKQIIINVLSNSDKFTTKGFISLDVFEEKKDNKRFVKFIIQDSGIGMSEATIEKLATPFYSTNENDNNKTGCGLGLLIVKELISKLGEGFNITSVVGSGTKISFSIEDQSYLKQTQSLTTLVPEITVSIQPPTSEESRTTKNTLANNDFNINIPNKALCNDQLAFNIKNITFPPGSHRSQTVINPMATESLILPKILSKASEKQFLKFSKFPRTIKRNFSSYILGRTNSIEESKKGYFINLSIETKECFEFIGQQEIVPKIRLSKDKRIISTSKNDLKLSNLQTGSTNNLKPNFADVFKDFSKLKLKSVEISDSKDISTLLKASTPIRVLIVDDYETIRKSIVKIFQKIEDTNTEHSFLCDQEDDGFRALIKIIETSVFNNNNYDLIILDEEMTYMNGTELYRMLKYMADNDIGTRASFDKNIINKIIMCSGDTKGVKDKIGIKDDMIVSKPITKSFLENYIKGIMNR